MRKPITANKKEYNALRQIIRKAMNKTKLHTWEPNIKVQKCAEWQWEQLEKIFKRLGHFPLK
jgi:hypothetical protein